MDLRTPSPSPLAGEGGARSRSEWEGEGRPIEFVDLHARAAWMRKHPTEAERRLWSLLRNRRLAAFRFRRQEVIAPYIVDFVCYAERLIIEADGSQHAGSEADDRRDAYLRRQGFRVLRFWNNHILGESEVVAQTVATALAPHPPTAARRAPPSPVKGEGLGVNHA